MHKTHAQIRLPHIAGAFFLSAAFLAHAQSSTSAPTPSTQANLQTQANQEKKDQGKKGQVILERSLDANGDAVDAQSSPQDAKAVSSAPTAEDAERSALETTAFDMDVRL
ncbi:MAG TPA: hypothetical protein VIM62_04315, partial [Acidobacteriaceae bacterium]